MAGPAYSPIIQCTGIGALTHIDSKIPRQNPRDTIDESSNLFDSVLEEVRIRGFAS